MRCAARSRTLAGGDRAGGAADIRGVPYLAPNTTKAGPVGPAFVLVGVAGFEPTTSSSRTKRAAKLRYTPKQQAQV